VGEGTSRSSRVAGLLAYLQAEPGLPIDPSDLSRRFDLEPEFVRNVINDLGRRESSVAVRNPGIPKWIAGLRAHGALPVTLTTILAFEFFATLFLVRGGAKDLYAPRYAAAGLFFVLIAVNGCFYFQAARFRLVLIGTALLATLTLLINLIPLLSVHSPNSHLPQVVVLVLVATLYNSFVYGGLGLLFTALGLMRRKRLEERKASRQTLLKRYFEVSERLRNPSPSAPPDWIATLSAGFLRHLYGWSLGLGFLTTAATIPVFRLLGIDPYAVGLPPGMGIPALCLYILVGMANIALYAALAFLSGSARKAALSSACFSAAGLLATLIPTSDPAISNVWKPQYMAFYGGVSAVLVIFCAAIGAATEVYFQGVRERKIRDNDEATLVSELVRLQWRLVERPAIVNVLVIDAVGSTGMKATADPLQAEYAFRLYHEWIAGISLAQGGSVLATLGDGAILAFARPEEALLAARSTLGDLDRFNREVNRLETPFRIRVALHAGTAVANLNDVMFAEVIDVAAHLEKSAPVNGLVVSAAFAVQMPTEPFGPTDLVVDGQKLLLDGPK